MSNNNYASSTLPTAATLSATTSPIPESQSASVTKTSASQTPPGVIQREEMGIVSYPKVELYISSL